MGKLNLTIRDENGMITHKQCSDCNEIKSIDNYKFVLPKRNVLEGRPGYYYSECTDCKKLRDRKRVAKFTHIEKAKNREACIKYQKKLKQLRALEGNEKKPRVIKPKTSCKIFYNICEETGKMFIAKHKLNKRSKEGEEIFKEKYKLILIERKTKGGLIRKCIVCGNEFNKVDTSSHKFCSDECKGEYRIIYKTTHKRKYKRHVGNRGHRKRAKMYGCIYESVKSIKVFEKYKWKCAKCGIKTPKKLIGSNKINMPTIDHIVPMSLGGAHTYSNLQCLCMLCNAKKSNKLEGQLTIAI